jgi:UDP-2,3-diacylglucosamine hydrolase
MKTYFISDLHLSETYPEITKKFTDFLVSVTAKCKALHILGDLFEVWIGDDAASSFQLEIAKQLKSASKHFPIYFMPGNRDFLLGKHYCQMAGMNYLSDPSVITINQGKIVLMHGDGLCSDDKLFQFYRYIVRSSIFIKIFCILPLKWREKIALKMRLNSKKRNQKISIELMDINSGTLVHRMDKQNVSQAIYGHTHRPSIRLVQCTKGLKQVFVLSDWHEQGNALIIDSNSLKKLIYF